MTIAVFFGVAMTAALVVRLVLYKRTLTWLKNLCFCAVLLLCLFILGASSGTAPTRTDPDAYREYLFGMVLTALMYTAATHFIARLIARRKEMIPKRHDNTRKAVRHGRAPEQMPKRHGETESAPVTPPPAQPVNTQPVQPKAPVRQTLRVCLRCGHRLSGPFCGECGYNQTAGNVILLRYVDPERLQISKKN